MNEVSVGDRVMAIRSSGEGKAFVYGSGTYEGEHVPGEEAGGLAVHLREMGRANPRIRLDDGAVVYGAECWWAPEHVAAQMIAERGFEVVPVSITEDRERANREVAEAALRARQEARAALDHGWQAMVIDAAARSGQELDARERSWLRGAYLAGCGAALVHVHQGAGTAAALAVLQEITAEAREEAASGQ